MSAGKATPRSVATYIEVFDEVILGGQMRGLASLALLSVGSA